ncbi:hypothetical protein T492DRAFT_1014775 [Pavlovales sp. CCMP2436]|nr:hypothetical protein T492DRAFT_1014775 [Pavlovales sp. CCMP2436]|mmetsp:Transcript_28389/g.70007  ORF Transcript_28389/g.70007 Transcript_28389/m.70007 type:complete len:203 (+) Transcript_28389:237-845(+)
MCTIATQHTLRPAKIPRVCLRAAHPAHTRCHHHPLCPLRLPGMLSEATMHHLRDPMPACNDDAWTLAGLDSLDITDWVVDMGIYSHATIDEGRLQLRFEDGDLSDKDFRSTTVNLFVREHSNTFSLTWIDVSSSACHTEFELAMPNYYLEEQLQLDLVFEDREWGENYQVEEQLILDQLLEVPRVQHVLPRTTSTRQRAVEH